MPQTNTDADFSITFYSKNLDGSQGDPLYLTTNGQTGGPKLTMAAWLKAFAGDTDAALEYSTTDGTLVIQNAPNDNVLLFHQEWSTMEEVPAGTYAMDVIALISGTSRKPFGLYQVTVRQGVTDPLP